MAGDANRRKGALEGVKELRRLAGRLSHGLPESARDHAEAAFYASALAEANSAIATASTSAEFLVGLITQRRVLTEAGAVDEREEDELIFLIGCFADEVVFDRGMEGTDPEVLAAEVLEELGAEDLASLLRRDPELFSERHQRGRKSLRYRGPYG